MTININEFFEEFKRCFETKIIKNNVLVTRVEGIKPNIIHTNNGHGIVFQIKGDERNCPCFYIEEIARDYDGSEASMMSICIGVNNSINAMPQNICDSAWRDNATFNHTTIVVAMPLADVPQTYDKNISRIELDEFGLVLYFKTLTGIAPNGSIYSHITFDNATPLCVYKNNGGDKSDWNNYAFDRSLYNCVWGNTLSKAAMQIGEAEIKFPNDFKLILFNNHSDFAEYAYMLRKELVEGISKNVYDCDIIYIIPMDSRHGAYICFNKQKYMQENNATEQEFKDYAITIISTLINRNAINKNVNIAIWKPDLPSTIPSVDLLGIAATSDNPTEKHYTGNDAITKGDLGL